MAESGGRDSTHQVEIAIALGIDEPAALSLYEADRLRGIVSDEDISPSLGEIGVSGHEDDFVMARGFRPDENEA
jgi:hypothetical protein